MSPERQRYLRLYHAHTRIDEERAHLWSHRTMSRLDYLFRRLTRDPHLTVQEVSDEYDELQHLVDTRMATLDARQRRLPPLPVSQSCCLPSLPTSKGE